MEKQIPNCKLSSANISRTVGLKTRDKTKGSIKTDSPAKIRIKRKCQGMRLAFIE